MGNSGYLETKCHNGSVIGYCLSRTSKLTNWWYVGWVALMSSQSSGSKLAIPQDNEIFEENI